MPHRNPASPKRPRSPQPWLLAAGGAALLAATLQLFSTPAPAPTLAKGSEANAAGGAAPATLALLVGIDACAPSGREDDFGALQGPSNDVHRARTLLVERFGFDPTGIVVLEGPQATHEAIVRTFHHHLIEGAGPATRVVFWFSGHGSRVPDGSQQDGSPRESDEAAFDETLVAYDSRSVDPDGGYDLTDDELNSLLAAVPATDVLVVTDCCHAGGVLRGGRRAAGVREWCPGTVGMRSSRLDSFWPTDVTLHDDPHTEDLSAVVQIAACDALDQAGEVATPCGTFGTLTWFLTQALRECAPDTSWGELAATVRARVLGHGTQPQQRVALSGDARRAVFGGRGRSVPDGFAVDREGPSRLWIAAGSLHGIAEGAQLQLVDLDGRAVGSAWVRYVHTTTCVAEWSGPGNAPEQVMRAQLTSLGSGQPQLRIAIEGLDGELLDGCPFATSSPPAAADYVLRQVGEQLGLFDLGGRWLRSCANEPAALRQAIQREQRFLTLWTGLAAPGRYRLEIAVRPATAGDGLAKGRPLAGVRGGAGRGAGAFCAVVGAERFASQGGGSLLRIAITNLEDADLFVALVSATESREVNVLLGRDADNLVRAHGTIEKLVLVGPSVGWPADKPMVDRYLAIATPRYADFNAFAADAELAETRGGDAGLPPFLQAALGGTRTRGDLDAPAWGIASCDLLLVTPAVFERALGR